MIDLVPDADQLEMITTVAGFLDRELPRLLAGHPGRAASHASLIRSCGELGWLSLTVPAERGGAGLGTAEECLVFRELGRRLVTLTFLANSVAARVAYAAGQTELGGRLASGESLAGLAEPADESGTLAWWADEVADYVLIADVRGRALRLVERDALGIRSTTATIDPRYRLIKAVAAGRPVLAEVTGSLAERLSDSGAVLAAAVLTGMAEYARDQSVSYARTRVQFGRPIGVHQAVKHRCADMAMRTEAAWAQTCWAALALDAQPVPAPLDVSAAKAVAARAALANCADNIQNHGGIGYTAEHDAHLYLKRARVVERMFGATSWHLDRVLASDPASAVAGP